MSLFKIEGGTLKGLPHPRERLVTLPLLKKLGFFPALAIQGARQTGKSFLVRELLGKALNKMQYFTLDDEAIRSLVQSSARSFLISHEDAHPLAIDEAQKCPALFDALKLLIDQKKTPGKYIILGSTEFSRLTLIRESLTGRMGKIRVYPLILNECVSTQHSIKHSDVLRYLKTGGLPGICFSRSEEHRDFLFQEWIDLTCLRDIHQIKNLKLDGELARKILTQTARLEEPTKAAIASALRENPQKVAKGIS